MNDTWIERVLTIAHIAIFAALAIVGIIGVCLGHWNALLTVFCCSVMVWTLSKDLKEEKGGTK